MKLSFLLISLTAHGFIFALGGFSTQQAIVGIVPGRNSIEVNLVDAAPRQSSTTLAPLSLPPTVAPPPPQPLPSTETTVLTQADSSPSHNTAAAPVPLPAKISHSQEKFSKKHSNRGSSGKDVATVSSRAGAIVNREPDYLSNPAPIYPQAAREQQQEGLVILDVVVSTEGLSETIKIFLGSGYYLLDEAALKAVQRYRFRPATLNGMKVRSQVRVPIRFRMEG